MKRFGLVIRTQGDPEIAAALAAGVEAGTRRDVINASSEAVRRVAMYQHSPEEWEAMTIKARYDYGQDRPTPRWARPLLVGYAMLCWGLSQAYHAQDRVLGGRMRSC